MTAVTAVTAFVVPAPVFKKPSRPSRLSQGEKCKFLASIVDVIPHPQKSQGNSLEPYQERRRAMRSRSVHIQVWLNEREAAALEKNVKRTGLTREAYLRQLIQGYVPRELPPVDYYRFMEQLYRVMEKLDIIASQFYASGVADLERYQSVEEEMKKLVMDLTEAIVLPAKL